MFSLINRAIKKARINGDYDDLIVIATRANTPEAQRLLREAIERERREEKMAFAEYRKFVDETLGE